MAILSLPLIHIEQLSVTGKSMGIGHLRVVVANRLGKPAQEKYGKDNWPCSTWP